MLPAVSLLVLIVHCWHCVTAEGECQLPSVALINSFINDSFLGQIEVMIFNHTFACLAVGQIHQLYRSASVVVKYMVSNTTFTSQFETACNVDPVENGTTVWMYNKTSFRNVPASAINLSTKEDCNSCININDYACDGK